jgi:hypothetical protein
MTSLPSLGTRRRCPPSCQTVRTASPKAILAFSYLPIIGALAGQTNASVTVYNFTFDAGHRLMDWNSTLRNTTDKTGLLNQ